MKSRIVIGDVHGCFLTLMALIAKFPKDIPITLCGDLIDRGPRSRQVINWVRENNIDSCIGNHEEMLQDESQPWLDHGGYECLESYGCRRFQTGDVNSIVFPDDESIDQFEADKKFVKTLPLWIEYPDVVDKNGRKLVVSHSSVSTVWNMPDWKKELYRVQIRNTVLFNRFTTIADIRSIYNVFGHTICDGGPKVKECYANVDTGCFDFTIPTRGKLTALQFPEMIIYQQENIDQTGNIPCQVVSIK